jgi:hypothetical protein
MPDVARRVQWRGADGAILIVAEPRLVATVTAGGGDPAPQRM